VNGLDLLILSILAISAVLSLFRGFVSEVLSLLFWILAFWLAARLAAPVSTLFVDVVQSPTAQLSFAFIALLLGFGALGGLLIWLVRRFLHSTGLGPTDRMLGLLFGAARGVVIVVALTLLGRFTTMPQDPAWMASRLLPHFDRLAQQSTLLLPQGIRDRIQALSNPASLLTAGLPVELAPAAPVAAASVAGGKPPAAPKPPPGAGAQVVSSEVAKP
jgi:membrane protein required for colicin V production